MKGTITKGPPFQRSLSREYDINPRLERMDRSEIQYIMNKGYLAPDYIT